MQVTGILNQPSTSRQWSVSMSESAVPVVRSYVDGLHGQVHLRTARPVETSARPLLCLHLSPLSGLVYEQFLAEIGQDRLAIAPDTPGYGMSDPPPSAPDIAGYARAMTHLLDSLDLSEVDVLGYATGSKIAFELALAEPDRVRSIFLISAPDYTEEEIAHMTAFLGHVIDPVDDGTHLLELWEQVKGYPTNPERMNVFPDHIRAGDRKPWGPLAAFSYRYRDRIDELLQPLFVLNIQTEITEPTRRLSDVLAPNRYLERLDWTHGFLDIDTEEFAELVRAFVRDA